MSVAVLTNAYREEEWIDGCIRQFLPFDLPHHVLHSVISWNGERGPSDNTLEVAHDLGARVWAGIWSTEAQQFNFGLETLREYDWVIICDADERYRYSNIEALLDHLRNINPNCQGIKTNNWNVYWRTADYEIFPEQTDYPLIAVRPDVVFQAARNPGPISIEFVASRMYHFSYVRTNEAMWSKINNFSHRDEFDLKNWYDNKWLNWTPESIDLHPVVPEQFKQAVYNPCPDEIKALIPNEDFSHHSPHAGS